MGQRQPSEPCFNQLVTTRLYRHWHEHCVLFFLHCRTCGSLEMSHALSLSPAEPTYRLSGFAGNPIAKHLRLCSARLRDKEWWSLHTTMSIFHTRSDHSRTGRAARLASKLTRLANRLPGTIVPDWKFGWPTPRLPDSCPTLLNFRLGFVPRFLLAYILVQWTWFSGVTGCTWISCIRWRQRTNFTAPGCTCCTLSWASCMARCGRSSHSSPRQVSDHKTLWQDEPKPFLCSFNSNNVSMRKGGSYKRQAWCRGACLEVVPEHENSKVHRLVVPGTSFERSHFKLNWLWLVRRIDSFSFWLRILFQFSFSSTVFLVCVLPLAHFFHPFSIGSSKSLPCKEWRYDWDRRPTLELHGCCCRWVYGLLWARDGWLLCFLLVMVSLLGCLLWLHTPLCPWKSGLFYWVQSRKSSSSTVADCCQTRVLTVTAAILATHLRGLWWSMCEPILIFFFLCQTVLVSRFSSMVFSVDDCCIF